jgi:hypothetical protein
LTTELGGAVVTPVGVTAGVVAAVSILVVSVVDVSPEPSGRAAFGVTVLAPEVLVAALATCAEKDAGAVWESSAMATNTAVVSGMTRPGRLSIFISTAFSYSKIGRLCAGLS